MELKLDHQILKAIDSFQTEMNQLPIKLSRELFHPDMVDSLHGIAHTARVLFSSHLISNAIELPEPERKACYISAIIHDLGRTDENVTDEHGYNSMVMYKEQIESIFPDPELQRQVKEAIEYHSIDDPYCPEHVRQNIIWKVLKDADALDRSRFHWSGCDPSYLRLGIYDTPIGQSIMTLTSLLPMVTVNFKGNDPYSGLIDSCRSLFSYFR